MKKILLVLTILPLITLAQDKYRTFNAAAPKGVNTIIVKNVSFDTIVNNLLDRGFIIADMSREFKTVKTDWKKACSDCVPEIFFYVSIKDSSAAITGKWRSNGNFLFPVTTTKSQESALTFDIENQKWGAYKYTFNIMNEFALSLHGEIEYKKQ